MKIYDVSRLPSSIVLGWDGENNWRPIAFDCAALLTGHPDAVVTLWLLPKGESQAFPVALERDGDTVVWTPLNEEMTAEHGQLQIVVQDGTDVGKSKVVDYTVHDSLVGGADHPAETPSWAVQVVEDVTEAARHYPRIGDNGNWFVWDATAGEWVDTGVAAGGSGGSGAVTSVNNVQPDANGNVSLSANDVGAGTYSKPTGGIPASDLAAGVKESLNKADTALQTAPVTSVNGQTGAVTLTASEVGALPSSTSIPTKVSDLTNDSGFQTAAQVQSAIAAAAELPSGGTAGDFLCKTASGVAWETVPTYTGGSY